MDIKDVLLQNENALPTITDTEHSSAAAVAGGSGAMVGNTGALPSVTASSSTYWKFGVSSIVGLLGMYYLAAGKKQSDFGKMMLGAGLTLASFFLF